MSEKMLLTQALDERDSLKEEIRKLIENTSSCFVDVIRENDKRLIKKNWKRKLLSQRRKNYMKESRRA